MTDTNSWMWYPGTVWPGFSLANQDNLNAGGNGMSIDPASYTEVILRDADGDGVIYDHDTNDVYPASYAEGVIFPDVGWRDPQEMVLFLDSSLVIDGVTYGGLDMEVWLFTDGTWAARLKDSSIPGGTYWHEVTQITLGVRDGLEYDGAAIVAIDEPFVCFAAGTRLATPQGWQRVEDLRPGDLILTLEEGAQPICWTGARSLDGQGAAAPMVVATGHLGNSRPVVLSPQHRVLLGGPTLAQHCGLTEALSAVKHLEGRGVTRQPGRTLRYHHLLMARHQIVLAEGLLAETLYPGPQARKSFAPAQLDAMADCLPGQSLDGYGPLARPVPRGRLIRQIPGQDLTPRAALAAFATRYGLSLSLPA